MSKDPNYVQRAEEIAATLDAAYESLRAAVRSLDAATELMRREDSDHHRSLDSARGAADLAAISVVQRMYSWRDYAEARKRQH